MLQTLSGRSLNRIESFNTRYRCNSGVKFKAIQLSFRFLLCLHQTCVRYLLGIDTYLVNIRANCMLWLGGSFSSPNSGRELCSRTVFHLWSCFLLKPFYRLFSLVFLLGPYVSFCLRWLFFFLKTVLVYPQMSK